ncbi:MAG: hypothetical protein J7L21_06460 [Sulfurimonas sp.]|nr:hypothetical protein [Sulfurimonas sp.]
MPKMLLMFLLSILSVYAQTINFRETKFIEALELSTYRDGNISYYKNKTVIKYKDGKTITKVANILTVHNDNNEILTTMDLNKKPAVAIYFKLTKALFSKNFKSLDKSFYIKKHQGNKYTFEPKDDLKEVVSSIELSLRSDDTVKFFVIDFKNRDTIKIEAK